MTSQETDANLSRRVIALIYDLFLLFGILFVAGLPLPLIPESIRLAGFIRGLTFFYMLLEAIS